MVFQCDYIIPALSNVMYLKRRRNEKFFFEDFDKNLNIMASLSISVIAKL